MTYIRTPLRVVFLVIVFLAILAGTGFSETTYLLINKNNPAASFDSKEIKKIYLGNKTKWDDNSPIVLTILKGDDHKKFLKAFIGRTNSQFAMTWKKKMMTGKGKMPKKFSGTAEMSKFISNTPGAIGYSTTNSDILDGIKVISLN